MIRAAFISLLLLTLCYLLIPEPNFPPPPPGVLTSTEPADTESVYRKAYYTNYSRDQIINYYKQAFRLAYIPFQLRLNHPPETAQELIRDQTRSNYLEELVHPFRESLLINGFEPTKPTEQINISGVHYLNKITVRMIPSGVFSRLTAMILTCSFIICFWKEYVKR